MNRWFTVLLLISLVGSGCAVGPDFIPPENNLNTSYQGLSLNASQIKTSAEAATETEWWKNFEDPILNELLAEAVKSNLDLQTAMSRVLQAKAERGLAFSDLLPDVFANGNLTREQLSENVDNFGQPLTTYDRYRVGLDLSWELDLFGGNRRALESARANLAAKVYESRAILLSLLSETALNYLSLRSLQHQLEVTKLNVDVQSKTLQFTQSRFEGGIATRLDLVRAKAQLAGTSASIPQLEQRIMRTIHTLSLLLGLEPNALKERLLPTRTLPKNPTNIPVGLPSDILRRRPDIKRAEFELAAATAEIGVAISHLFPKFSLTAALGVSSNDYSDLGRQSSAFWSVIPGFSWPVFSGTKIASNIELHEERGKEALLNYRKTVLQALKEVEDSLVHVSKEQERQSHLNESVKANLEAVELSKDLYEQGQVDFLSLLQAQGNLFMTQATLADSEGALAADIVQLYKALGGGWEGLVNENFIDNSGAVWTVHK